MPPAAHLLFLRSPGPTHIGMTADCHPATAPACGDADDGMQQTLNNL